MKLHANTVWAEPLFVTVASMNDGGKSITENSPHIRRHTAQDRTTKLTTLEEHVSTIKPKKRHNITMCFELKKHEDCKPISEIMSSELKEPSNDS